MNELQYENTIDEIGLLRERVRKLEDNDFITAYYKGYSNEGMSADEIENEIKNLNMQIGFLEEELNNY